MSFSRRVGVLVVTLCALGISNAGPIYSVYPIHAPTGWTYVDVSGINDSGQVAGRGAPTHGIVQAFIGTTSGSTAIPLIPGWCEMYTEDFPINDAGQVVGSGTGGGWIWDPVNGSRALTDLVPAGWYITRAKSINDRGQILAYGSILLATLTRRKSRNRLGQ